MSTIEINDAKAFRNWWHLLDQELVDQGRDKASREDARYYYPRGYTPFGASVQVIIERVRKETIR